MHVIDVMAMVMEVMDIVIERRYKNVIDVMAMVMDTAIPSKL